MDLDVGFWACLILATIHGYHNDEGSRSGLYSTFYFILAIAQFIGNIIILVGDK
jgi:hypothetical protein